MTTILLSVFVFLVLFIGMAIGVIFSNKPVKGTCGGLSQLDLGDCEICGGNPKKCDSDKPIPRLTHNKAYDANQS